MAHFIFYDVRKIIFHSSFQKKNIKSHDWKLIFNILLYKQVIFTLICSNYNSIESSNYRRKSGPLPHLFCYHQQFLFLY